jgi:hypothetical protein
LVLLDDLISTFCFYLLDRIWIILQLFLEYHKNVI